MRVFLAGLLLLLLAYPVGAGEGSIKLKEGDGRRQVFIHCSICHSVDYIPMNSPFLDKAGWEKEVSKMEKFGAKMTPAERTAIVDYLSKNYSGSGPT
ncbi:MAG: cytochrome c [Candidatus Eremiobacteraeota bacterium]|nr:cytochrome c [Candidatus Eremiobacteraeota bacterium]